MRLNGSVLSEPLAWGRKRLLVILYCWCSALHSTVSEENSSLCGLAAECVICNVPYPDQMMDLEIWLLEICLVERPLLCKHEV